jgi:aquaporin Z
VELSRRLGAELVGTFILVFGGAGSAVLAATYLDPATGDTTALGIGFLGVSLAFGLTVVCGAYALGHISGGHFNPAITVGLATAGRFERRDVVPYVVAQVAGALAAAGTIWLIAVNRQGQTADDLAAGGFASNGFDDWSPAGFNLLAVLVVEVVLTAVFLVVIMGVTDKRASKGFAALAIGLSLTLVHLVSIPAVAAALGGEAGPLGQLWLFWLAPVLGGVIGALVYKLMSGKDTVADAEVMGVD